ncbi:probable transmembrane reductase CYB561D1 isoform X2 [Hyperolius riggenbachi]|uniref:probable transmembrane reductase CYB561D1 isoform X2 n=1 Tax=Hyperolius riggenbachi TaxID=752182 RepID=UPI0035A3331F
MMAAIHSAALCPVRMLRTRKGGRAASRCNRGGFRRKVMPETSIPYTPLGVDSKRVPDFWLYQCLRRFNGFLAHVLALGLTIFLIILARPGTSLFSWHPVFMAAAYCLCMTEAVLLLSPETSPFCPLTRKSKTRLHWLLQLCVPFFAVAGITFIICNKNRTEQPHFTSWHSILGGLTLIATCCQAVCGLALLCPQLVQITAVSRLKLYHVTCGLLVYLLATSTVLLGSRSKLQIYTGRHDETL